MDDKCTLNNILSNIVHRQDYYFRNKNADLCLSESDFYPPSDDRVLESYIEDIDDGDNYVDYCRYIFKLYEDEGYYES